MFRLQLPEKLLPLLEPKRYKVLHGGRGSAKSWSVARALIHLATIKPIRVLCARETQKSIQESVHRLLKDQIDLLGVGHLFDVQETKILGANGSDFAFAGIRQQGVANLKSFEGVDICWVEEAQVVTKRSWDVLIPTIRKPGSEIWITFNPELEDDETYKRFVTDGRDDPNMFVCEVNFTDNPWFGGELEIERQTMLRRDPVGYKTTWEGRCRPAVEGAIYANEIARMLDEKRYCNVPYDPMLKVHTFWDLGLSDNMRIICVQRSASEIRVIDHLAGNYSLIRLDDYIRELESRKYRWGKDYIPHDGRAKQTGTGKSTEQMLKDLGRDVEVLDALPVEQGITAAATLMPRLYVDRTKCADWMANIKRYKRRKNETTGAFGEPLHDEASHDADTLRYLAMKADQLTNDDWGGSLNYPRLTTA